MEVFSSKAVYLKSGKLFFLKESDAATVREKLIGLDELGIPDFIEVTCFDDEKYLLRTADISAVEL